MAKRNQHVVPHDYDPAVLPLEMNNRLTQTASALRGALEELLPSLSETWWELA